MIDGMKIIKLNKIVDERGMVLHMLKVSSENFLKFGEVYFSVVYKNIVKAWKKHLEMTQNLCVPAGKIKLVCFDDRMNSKTFGKSFEIIFGRDNYCLVSIPPGIWYGFQGIDYEESLICNCADLEHNPVEVERKSFDDPSIPYSWSI